MRPNDDWRKSLSRIDLCKYFGVFCDAIYARYSGGGGFLMSQKRLREAEGKRWILCQRAAGLANGPRAIELPESRWAESVVAY